MGEPTTTDQQAWAEKMGKLVGASPTPITLAFPPRTPAPPGVGPGYQIDPDTMRKIMEENKKAEEKRLKDAQDALEEARKWLCAVPDGELRQMTIPSMVVKIKEKFPAVHDLPKAKTLMDMVEKVLTDRRYMFDKGLLGDPKKLAMEKIIGAYIAALPKNVTAIVSDGGIKLVLTGPAEGADAAAGKTSEKEKFEFKNKDYTIQISNAAWKALDPALRAKWKGLNDEATLLEKLQAKITSMKKEWESGVMGGPYSKVELEARIKDLEAEFKGRWDTLRESINANAKLSTDGLKATITETKQKVSDQKVGAELELKLEDMSAGLKAFASTPDLKTALTITGSAEKITAKVEAEAIKTGTAVTLTYEKALKEVKEQLELQVKQGNTTVAVTLSKEAVKLEEKLKTFKDSNSKNFETVKGLEDDLQMLKLEVKAGFTAGNFKIVAGGSVATGGQVGGKVQVDLMLEKGISFIGGDQKISFIADVSNKGYAFSLMFSVNEMPEIGDVHKANAEADAKIRKLYDLVKDTQIRNMDDAEKIQKAFKAVLDPLQDSVKAMKKADKRKIAVQLGITLTGEIQSDGRMPPPVPGFGIKVNF